MSDELTKHIWLEVSNVRSDTGSGTKVAVQLKGDRSPREPQWWPVAARAAGKDAADTAKAIFTALDSKKIVLAGLGIVEDKLCCELIRIQFTDSGSR